MAPRRWYYYGAWPKGRPVKPNPHPPGDWQGLHPEFARRLAALCQYYEIRVISGWRSWDEQNYLYVNQGRPGFNPANPPGRSNHEAIPRGEAMSLAADLGPESVFDSGNISASEAAWIATTFGLHFPLRFVEKEDHHCQPIEVLNTAYSGVPELQTWSLP